MCAVPRVISLIGRWTDRTRPIVRLDLMNRMVTKGYQKGVYEWVTKGIKGGSTAGSTINGFNMNVLWDGAGVMLYGSERNEHELR